MRIGSPRSYAVSCSEQRHGLFPRFPVTSRILSNHLLRPQAVSALVLPIQGRVLRSGLGGDAEPEELGISLSHGLAPFR